jgi:hypothetical protein
MCSKGCFHTAFAWNAAFALPLYATALYHFYGLLFNGPRKVISAGSLL